MKKFISSVLVFIIMVISMGSTAFVKSCPPRKGLGTPATVVSQPVLPMLNQPPIIPNVPDDLLPVDIPEFFATYDGFGLDDADSFTLPEQSIPAAEVPAQAQQVPFDYKASTAYWLLNQRFGKLPKEKLLELVNKVREFLEKEGTLLPILSRDEKRHKGLIYKYIDKNLGYIARVLPYIHL